MDSNIEQELKSELESTCSRLGIKGYLLTFISDDKFHFIGSVETEAFLPYIMGKVTEKLLKR